VKGCGIGNAACSHGGGHRDEITGSCTCYGKKTVKLLEQRIKCNDVVERWEGCRGSTEMAACTKPPEQFFKPALVDVRVSALCCYERQAIQQASRKEIIEEGEVGGRGKELRLVRQRGGRRARARTALRLNELLTPEDNAHVALPLHSHGVIHASLCRQHIDLWQLFAGSRLHF
jgi:hypothetical protein